MRAHRRRQADLARLRSPAPVASSSAGHGAARPASARRSAPVSGPAPSAAAVEGAPVRDAESATVPGVPDEPVTAGAAPSPLDVALEVAPATEAVAPVVESSVVDSPVVTDVMVPILDEDDMPITWDPVPVPRPTYTMKARAERREVAPAAVTPDPAPVVREDEDEDTAYDQRRAAGA